MFYTIRNAGFQAIKDFVSSRITRVVFNWSILSCVDGEAGTKEDKAPEHPKRARHCGTWVRNSDGGIFSSPNYPNMYPPNKDCLYVLEGNQ